MLQLSGLRLIESALEMAADVPRMRRSIYHVAPLLKNGQGIDAEIFHPLGFRQRQVASAALIPFKSRAWRHQIRRRLLLETRKRNASALTEIEPKIFLHRRNLYLSALIVSD
jgi:hypothetical protein